MPENPARVWLLYDAEKRGSETQCRGLAKALQYEAAPFAIPKLGWLRFVPRKLWYYALPLYHKRLQGLLDAAPFPKLIISSGTRASAVAAYLRQQSRKANGQTRVINLLNPRLPVDWFDLIITPKHDQLHAPNVIQTLGPINNLAQDLETLTRPDTTKQQIITVLIGGKSKAFTVKPKDIETLGQQLCHLYRTRDVKFLVSFSRRTPQLCKQLFQAQTNRIDLELYDGQGDNPYQRYLAAADAIIVTADSMSMVTEACATGKPVYVVSLNGMPTKFKVFHQDLEAAGYTRPFKGQLDKWSGKKLDEMTEVAKKIKQLLEL